MAENKLSFEELGGRPMLEKIAKIFYDKVYLDAWMGQYFKEVPQKIIESQQVDFMVGALGGPNVYCGKLPVEAHTHMMVTEELFDLRQGLLTASMREAGAKPELMDRWLKIDQAFRGRIVKHSVNECRQRFSSEPILNFPKPYKKTG
jgi:truncated hemoglobin YjbI